MNEFAKYSQLMNQLNDEKLGEDCLDYVEMQGYLAASIISPVETTDEALLEEIIGDKWPGLAEEVKNGLQSDILNFHQWLSKRLLAAEPVEIDLEEDLDEEEQVEELEAWATGFMLKHLMDEESWFAAGEQEVAEMMLPIVTASGLVEEPEILEIRHDQELYQSMLESIPELLIDLYALFHEK